MGGQVHSADLSAVRIPFTEQFPQRMSRAMSMAARRRLPQLRLRYSPGVLAVQYTP